MKLATLLAAAALLATNPLYIGDTSSRSRHQDQDVQNLQKLARRANEPPVTPVVPGSVAPDFSYQTPDGKWRHLSDLLAQGPALMLVGTRDAQLTSLEKERARLLDLGVVPVAVLDGNARTVRAAVRRLGLHFTVIADPRAVIAAQFNALEPGTGAPLPCWFVIDRERRVCALDRTGLPEAGYDEIARDALAIPAPGVSLPATK